VLHPVFHGLEECGVVCSKSTHVYHCFGDSYLIELSLSLLSRSLTPLVVVADIGLATDTHLIGEVTLWLND
jgi:hypothetical protein